MSAGNERAVEFLVRRGGFWLLQWWRLGSAILGVLSFGLVDKGLMGERIYLDACWKALYSGKSTSPAKDPQP